MLSAQATDTSVNKATAKLFQSHTPCDSGAWEPSLKEYIKTITITNQSQQHHQTCQRLIETYGLSPIPVSHLKACLVSGEKLQMLSQYCF